MYFGAKRVDIQRVDDCGLIGPFLRDGFGICYRLAKSDRIPVEIFYMFDAVWAPHPTDSKAKFIFAQGTRGELWRKRAVTFVDERASEVEYAQRYISTHLTAYLEKISKYLARGERVGAAYYCVRTLSMIVSAIEFTESDESFDPDRLIRRSNSIEDPRLRNLAHRLGERALVHPETFAIPLINRAKKLVELAFAEKQSEAALRMLGELEGLL